MLASSLYLAPIQYYAHLYAADYITEDRGEHFVKQTYRNRCYIATPSGAQALTIPVVRDGAGHTPMRDVRISDHGNWRHLHWTALVSAYDSSPYFEYYADDFRPLYENDYHFLVDFNEALRHTVLDLLSLERDITVANDYIAQPTLDQCPDLRALISPKEPTERDECFMAQTYYQVFSDRTGFLPNLSIVDLLFNMGPESRIILKNSLK